MKVSVTLSANAGVALNIGGHRIWVDALHDRRAEPFSTVSPALQQKMLQCEAFQRPEWICYTHDHPDHYSRKLTQAAQQLWPQAQVLLPDAAWEQERTVAAGGLALRFVKLPHAGAQYADVLHYGMIISYLRRNILIPGDCAVGSETLAQAISGLHIDMALLNFPWITLNKGREFLQEHLAESTIYLYHLPFAGDDTAGYRGAARQAAGQVRNCTLLMEPLQTVTQDL